MVVTPKDAMKLSSVKDRNEVTALERKIDRCLRERYEGEPVYLDARSISTKIFDELRRKYSEAGWQVSLTGDPRFGETYLEFSEARRR